MRGSAFGVVRAREPSEAVVREGPGLDIWKAAGRSAGELNSQQLAQRTVCVVAIGAFRGIDIDEVAEGILLVVRARRLPPNVPYRQRCANATIRRRRRVSVG